MPYNLTIAAAHGPRMFRFDTAVAAFDAALECLKSGFELQAIADDRNGALSTIELRNAARLERMESIEPTGPSSSDTPSRRAGKR